MRESAQAVTLVAAEAGEQFAGARQIAQAIENIQQVTAQNAAAARQMERAAVELNNLAGRLTQEMGGQ